MAEVGGGGQLDLTAPFLASLLAGGGGGVGGVGEVRGVAGLHGHHGHGGGHGGHGHGHGGHGGHGGRAAGAVRRRTWVTKFMPEAVYEYYAATRALSAAALPASHPRVREVPGEFTSVMVLDAGGAEATHAVTGSLGYVTTLYKVVSVEDGVAYALRRVDNVRLPPALLGEVAARWAGVAHPGVVALRRVFGGGGGGPGALYFVHDYYPGAKSLRDAYLDGRSPPLPEAAVWSAAVQLAGALRAVHAAGLAFRGLDAGHVLVTGKGRLRVAGAGVLDALEADSKKPAAEQAAADVLSLGHLLLQLATRSPAPHRSQEHIRVHLQAVSTTYSPALTGLIFDLLSRPATVADLDAVLAPHVWAEAAALGDHADAQDELLAREADNGRLLRTLVKLGCVNERPAADGDAAWSETGERYLLKLYRDYVFHQVADDGRPVLDAAHMVDSLHRLDRGTADRILLSSRDGASLLVASYAQLRKALHTAFEELRAPGARAAAAEHAATPAAVPPAVRRCMRARGVAAPVGMTGMNAHAAALSAATAASLLSGADVGGGFTLADAAAAAAAAAAAYGGMYPGVGGDAGGVGGLDDGSGLDGGGGMGVLGGELESYDTGGAGGGDGGHDFSAQLAAPEFYPRPAAAGGAAGGGAAFYDDGTAAAAYGAFPGAGAGRPGGYGGGDYAAAAYGSGMGVGSGGMVDPTALAAAAWMHSAAAGGMGGGGGGGAGAFGDLNAAAPEWMPTWERR